MWRGGAWLAVATLLALASLPAGSGVELRTHGDASPPVPTLDSLLTGRSGPAPVAPFCAEEGKAVQVVYAWPRDAGRDPSAPGRIREAVHRANGVVHHQAESQWSQLVDLRVRCDEVGNVSVVEVELPTVSKDAVTYWAVVSDLEALGHDDPRTKYWVGVDGRHVLGYAGEAFTVEDLAPGPENVNNQGGTYALVYSATGSGPWLHELSHSLGAVQPEAPHATAGHHCWQGSDVMCYDDGSAGSRETEVVCGDYAHYDCRGDDYFSLDPEPGSFLATHWNLGSRSNHWFEFRGPVAEGGPGLPPFLPTLPALG